jgi:hypothetical protein
MRIIKLVNLENASLLISRLLNQLTMVDLSSGYYFKMSTQDISGVSFYQLNQNCQIKLFPGSKMSKKNVKQLLLSIDVIMQEKTSKYKNMQAQNPILILTLSLLHLSPHNKTVKLSEKLTPYGVKFVLCSMQQNLLRP